MPRYVRPPTTLSAEEDARVQLVLMPLAQTLLRELARSGPLLKSELVTATGASPMAVALRLADLERVGLVCTDATEPPGRRQGKRVRYDVDRSAVRRTVLDLGRYLLPDHESENL